MVAPSIPKHIIAFKDEATRSEFDQVSPRLQAFILAAGAYMYFKHGITLVVTDLLRDNKKSVHHYGNGVDFRMRDLTQEQGDDLVEFLKWQFPYYLKTPMPTKATYSVKDERRKDASIDWTAEHIHGQVNYREK